MVSFQEEERTKKSIFLPSRRSDDVRCHPGEDTSSGARDHHFMEDTRKN